MTANRLKGQERRVAAIAVNSARRDWLQAERTDRKHFALEGVIPFQQRGQCLRMDCAYLLIAKRAPDRNGGLTIGYPTREHAMAAANIICQQWPVVTVTAPDGSLVLQRESWDA